MIKKLYEQSLSQAAEKCGLTLAEADVLSFLRENPQFDTARDVCVYREVSKGYVSKAVESLVKRGYLEITKDGQDRRIQHLKISGRAKNTANTLHTAQFAFYENVTSSLTDKELSTMLSAIEKCAGNVAAEFKRLDINQK
jgi:MarR family transcriptional regulator for hemolysin